MVTARAKLAPLLQDFKERRTASVDWGVTLMFHYMDDLKEGYTTRQTVELTGVGRTTAIAVHDVLQRHQCLREGPLSNPSRKVWVGTPLLPEVGQVFNNLFTAYVARRSEGAYTEASFRERALGRVAYDYNLPMNTETLGGQHALLEAVSLKQWGHPEAVTYRALTSLAVWEQLYVPGREDLLKHVIQPPAHPRSAR
ncbi:MAG TPA: hypothetical protein VD735_03600 [Candidatus Saccharimonadales bacterium]|nr:hypothetical protein [Candidatus Saccharimonadales bacterium]